MAQKVQVFLIDDVDGGNADETISFGMDGTSYEIDLSEANAASLREALAPWVSHARRVGGRARPVRAAAARRPTPPAQRTHDEEASPKQIRTWAAQNGIQVSDRGRIPADVTKQYQEAVRTS